MYFPFFFNTVSYLDPDLEDKIPEINGSDPMQTDEGFLLPPVELASRRSQPLPFDFGRANLKWQTWQGSLPDGAVAIYNRHTRRYDYICKYRCEAGFYNPRMGPYCHYPFAGRAYRCSPFEILVNKDNFEFLEWKPGSFGSVPQNSVGTCKGGDKYVGMNRYGLGKVHPKHRAFFLPWKDKEYYYRKGYQVLTVNKDVISEHISDVKYKIESSIIFQYPPETMRTSTITNYACSEVGKGVTLSKTNTVEHRWDTGFFSTFGVQTSIKAEIPFLFEKKVEFSIQTTVEYLQGESVIEENLHSVTVDLKVPPNHSCTTRMVGYNYKLDIPYTARLTRTYQNGRTSWTVITGKYYGVQIGEVRAIVDRCKPLQNVNQCPGSLVQWSQEHHEESKDS